MPASEQVAVPTQAAEMAQADSAPQKVIEAIKSEQEAGPVEVGYKVGMHVPEFGMSLLDGSRVTSAGFVDEGKPACSFTSTRLGEELAASSCGASRMRSVQTTPIRSHSTS